MPNSNHIHLYSGCRWIEIYGLLCKQLAESGVNWDELPSYATFCAVRNEYAYIKKPKRAGMGKCSVCQAFRKRYVRTLIRKDQLGAISPGLLTGVQSNMQMKTTEKRTKIMSKLHAQCASTYTHMAAPSEPCLITTTMA